MCHLPDSYLPPNQVNDELFFVQEDRQTRTDNTFSFKSIRFEAPRHLPDRTLQIRFERRRPTQRVVVYYKGERMGEARPLDPRRQRSQAFPFGTPSLHFT